MKLLNSGLKSVNYFGMELLVPKDVTHICVQSDGKLWLYVYESCLGELPMLRNRLGTGIPAYWPYW